MSDVIRIWEAKQQQDGLNNLNEFVRFARDELTLYASQGWDADKWKPENGSGVLVFGFSKNAYDIEEQFVLPFMEFVKAFMRQQMTIKEVKPAYLWMVIFRYLYRALQQESLNKAPDILNVKSMTIFTVENMIRQSDDSQGRKYQLGGKLQKLCEWLRAKCILLTLPQYKNSFKRQVDKADVLSEEGDKWRAERCPSMHQMLCLAECFAKAKKVTDLYYSSVLALLCFAPARINELNGLTINSLQQDEYGVYYVVWFGSKGYPAHRKGVPNLMVSTVKEAFVRLIKIGKPAREAAKWAYEHPDEFFRHENCVTSDGFNEDIPLSDIEFAHAMQITGCLKRVNGTKINTATKWVTELLSEGAPTYRRLNQLTHLWYKTKGWPNNLKSDRPVWENLLLIREYELRQDHEAKKFSWIMPTINQINDQLKSRSGLLQPPSTLWERFQMIDEDGSPIKMTTHQLRVWLNTHAKIGGMDDWKIAMWSGRADIRQNAAYDLRTDDEKYQIKKTLMTLGHNESPSAITLHQVNLPVPLRSLGINRDGIADFTGLGFCTHNFAQTPCTKAGECTTCKDHICLKGLPETLDELIKLEKLISEQFNHAVQAADDDTFGADRWVTYLGWKLAHIRTIIQQVTDDNLPDGAVIRVPVAHDPSPTRRALEQKNMKTELADDTKVPTHLNIQQLLGID